MILLALNTKCTTPALAPTSSAREFTKENPWKGGTPIVYLTLVALVVLTCTARQGKCVLMDGTVLARRAASLLKACQETPDLLGKSGASVVFKGFRWNNLCHLPLF